MDQGATKASIEAALKNPPHQGMITAVPVIGENATIAEVEVLLVKHASDLDTLSYIYVVNEKKELRGVMSIKEVFRLPKTTKISEVMKKDIVSVRQHTEQERIALVAIEHNLKSIPVIDNEDHLLGVYPSDVILNILHKEHIESFLKFAGVHRFTDPAKTILTASAGTVIKKRLPWLLVGLGGSSLAATIVNLFEMTLQQQIILAAFIPAITYITDAAGTQTETIFIRSLSINRNMNLRQYFWRETKVGLALSFLLSVITSILILITKHSASLAAILGISFFVAILASIYVALFLPIVFLKAKIDPALTSGPFATIVSDIISLVVYLNVASLILRLLGPLGI
jgi:magnesium transporter